VEISRDSRWRGSVRSLEVGSEIFRERPFLTEKHFLAEVYRTLLRKGLHRTHRGPFLPQSEKDFQIENFASKTGLQMSPNQLQEIHHKYDSMAREQKEMRKTCLDIELMTEALRNFSVLKHITFSSPLEAYPRQPWGLKQSIQKLEGIISPLIKLDVDNRIMLRQDESSPFHSNVTQERLFEQRYFVFTTAATLSKFQMETLNIEGFLYPLASDKNRTNGMYMQREIRMASFWLGNLRRFQLSLCFGLSLNHLGILLKYLLNVEYLELTNVLKQKAGKVEQKIESQHFLGTAFTGVHLEKLRGVSLSFWYLNEDELVSFLISHTKTLRDVRLGALCFDRRTYPINDSPSFKELASTLRDDLALDSLRITGAFTIARNWPWKPSYFGQIPESEHIMWEPSKIWPDIQKLYCP
jgi:hypothetical protein